jgi:hypothetical protein
MVPPVHSDEHALVAARRLCGAILHQLGVTAPLLGAACSPTPPTGDEGGVTTNPGSNDGHADSPDGEVGSDVDDGPMEDESEDESESGFKLDVSPVSDVPPPPQCWGMWLTEEEALAAYPDCTLGPFDPNLYAQYLDLCVEHPPDGSCADICPPGELCFGMEACYWGSLYGICGPYETADGCCLLIAGEQPPPVGRPFVIAGTPRLAQLDGVSCDRVTAHWVEVARGEHASIAAFARFVAILQRHGAPARLIAEALAAAADEVRHAEQALALASSFAGRELTFGPLAVDDASPGDTDDLADALRAAVIEGCIDETLAAHEAACLAAHAEHPEVAKVLEQIAIDEARHAALAWKFVAWVIGERPQLRSIVSEAVAGVAMPELPELSEPDDALGLGCPSARLRARWRGIGLRELIEPCASNLLEFAHGPIDSWG